MAQGLEADRKWASKIAEGAVTSLPSLSLLLREQEPDFCVSGDSLIWFDTAGGPLTFGIEVQHRHPEAEFSLSPLFHLLMLS